ncbi:MAG: gliding motility-associated C-terminal domain-containing protein [Bacteroidales bacterium]|nr:gliding motility-associated C-terminal domain-containing protein [Bacteroidales bacterium]
MDSSKSVDDWTNPTESSPDYLIIPFSGSYLDPNWNAPNSNWGYQYPQDGVAYARFGAYKDISSACEFTRREYIQGKLSEPLKIGGKYIFGFYLTLAEVSTNASKIGIGFTKDSVYYNTMDCLMSQGFYPDLETDGFITDTANWTKVEWIYTATGGERFFTVGNFWCDSTTSFIFVNPDGDTYCSPSGYFVDNFFMYELTDTMSIHNVYIPNIFSPDGNGQNDVFRIRGTAISEIKRFLIYDRWGQEIFRCHTETGQSYSSDLCSWDGTYKGEAVPPGVYVYYAEVVLLNGETVIRKGNVTLTR